MKSSFDRQLVSEALRKSGGNASWLEQSQQPTQSSPDDMIDPLMSLDTPGDDDALVSSEPAAESTSGPLASLPPREEPAMSDVPAPAEPPAALQTAPTKPTRPVQRPAATVAPTTTEAPTAPAEPVEQRDFNRKASSGTLQNELQEGQNRTLDLVEQLGDKEHGGLVRAEGAEAKAGELGELRQIQRSRRENVTSRLDLNRAQKDEFEARINAKIDQMSDKMRNPPKDTMGMVMGIIGAVMSAGGKGGAASALQGLGSALNSKMRNWEAGLAADDAELKNLRGMFDMQNNDSESELRQEANLSALAVAEFDSALKQVEQTVESKEAKEAAALTRLTLRQQAAQHMLDIRKRAAGAQREQEIYQLLASAPTAEKRAALAGQFGALGQKVLQNIQKSDKGMADINQTVTDTQKAQAETAKTLTEAQKLAIEATNPQSKMSEGERRNDSVIAGVAGENGPYRRLQKIITAAGGDIKKMDMPRFGIGGISKYVPDALVPQENIQQSADIEALVSAALRAESGAQISDQEIINKRAKALGLDSSDETVRAQGLMTLMDQLGAFDTQGRLKKTSSGGVPSFKPDK